MVNCCVSEPVTATGIVTWWLTPLVPVIVTEYIPDGAFAGTDTVTIDEPEVLMDVGTGLTLEPGGRFDDALNDTAPLKKLNALTVKLNVELPPVVVVVAMDREVTFELMLKYGLEPLI